jgi:hypothetical protein
VRLRQRQFVSFVGCLGITLCWNGKAYWHFGGLCCHSLSMQQMELQQSLPFCQGAIPGPRVFFSTAWRPWGSFEFGLRATSKFLNTLLLHRNCRESTHQRLVPLKARPHYSCSCDSLCSRVMWTIWQVTRQAIRAARATGSWGSACCRYIKGVRNWSSVDEDLQAQVKARRVFQQAQAWRARARVMWTGLYSAKLSVRRSSWFSKLVG